MTFAQRMTLSVSFVILIGLMLVVPVEYGCGLDFFWLAGKYDHRAWERLFICWAMGTFVVMLIVSPRKT